MPVCNNPHSLRHVLLAPFNLGNSGGGVLLYPWQGERDLIVHERTSHSSNINTTK